MAEHLLAMMLGLARRLPALVRAQQQRIWRDWETHEEVRELQGQTLLIVGLGAVGQALAVRAAALGMTVHGVRRQAAAPLPPGVSQVYGLSDLRQAVAGADHIAVTLPDTPATHGVIDADVIAAMKPGAYIYNVGRGGVIDTAALTAALQSGHLGGAGLDVTDPEPLPAESPLWEMEEVLITAHTSGGTPHYWLRQGLLIADNLARWQSGQPLRNQVDLEHGY